MIRISSSIVTVFSIINFMFMLGCEGDKSVVDTGKTVKIGVIAPLSGNVKQWGESGLLGVETAIDLARSTLKNVRIELIEVDDGNDPERAKDALRELVDDHQVSAILILSGSDSTIGVAELADQYETPIVSTLSSHPAVTENQWLSQIMFDDNFQGTVAALFVLDELLINKVGIVKNSGDSHATILAEQFSRRFRDAGREIDIIDIAVVGVEKAVDQLRRKKLEFVYLPVGADEVIDFERAARAIGWNPQVMVGDGILSLVLLDQERDVYLADGMFATDIYSDGVQLTEYGKIVTSRFKKLFSEPGTTITALSCEGASILFKAVEFCGQEPDKSCINRMLRSGKEHEGIFGTVLIDSDGKAERPIFINRIKNGSLQFILEVN